MIWLTLLGLCAAGPAAPDTPPPPDEMLAVVEAVQTAAAGDRAAAVRALDRVLADHPGLVDARVARGVNRYFLGEADGARADLAYAFDGQVWTHDHVVSQTGTDVTLTRTTLDLLELRRVGAGILVVLAARRGALTEGRDLVERARAAFGPHPEGIAAEARLTLAAGQQAEAWSLLEGALVQPDPTRFIQSVVSEMLATAPESAPARARDWLAEAGEWTAHYNAAIGALRQRDHRRCVAEVVEGLAAFPGHARMVEVGYPCAARADLDRAAAWLEALGGPRRAEPWSVLAHARSLEAAHRPDEALALVDGLPRRLPGELPAQVETLQLEIHLAAGDLDRARKACTGRAPVAELGVAYALIGAERYDEAHRLLLGLCPALAHTTSESTCAQYLEYAATRR